MSVETIALSQTLEAETRVEVSEIGLRIYVSRIWLLPLLSEDERDLSDDIYCPVQRLNRSVHHLVLLLYEMQRDSHTTSLYAVEIAKILTIYVLRDCDSVF